MHIEELGQKKLSICYQPYLKHTGRNPGFDRVLIEDLLLEDVVLEDVMLEDVVLEDVVLEDVLLEDVF